MTCNMVTWRGLGHKGLPEAAVSLVADTALHLAVAAIAVHRVAGGKWLWNIGGSEYCVFWAICCVIVAMEA